MCYDDRVELLLQRLYIWLTKSKILIVKTDAIPSASTKVSVDRKLLFLFCFVYRLKRTPDISPTEEPKNRGKKLLFFFFKEQVKTRGIPREKFR